MRQPIARFGLCLGLPLVVTLFQVVPSAQDRLKAMPGYAQYTKMSAQLPGALRTGAVTATWSADGKSFEYARDGKRYRYDVATRQATEIGTAPEPAGRGGRGGRGGGAPERGRQYAFAESPDKAYRAQYQRDHPQHRADRSGHQGRDADHDRRQPREADQVRHGELGLRRRAGTDHRHVVVPRQPQAGLLPLRRERRARLPPPARSDQAPEHGRHRGLPEGGGAESCRRPPDLRRRDQAHVARRRSRRQALRQRGGWPLRLSRGVGARRQGTALQSHQPPAERPRARRRAG